MNVPAGRRHHHAVVSIEPSPRYTDPPGHDRRSPSTRRSSARFGVSPERMSGSQSAQSSAIERQRRVTGADRVDHEASVLAPEKVVAASVDAESQQVPVARRESDPVERRRLPGPFMQRRHPVGPDRGRHTNEPPDVRKARREVEQRSAPVESQVLGHSSPRGRVILVIGGCGHSARPAWGLRSNPRCAWFAPQVAEARHLRRLARGGSLGPVLPLGHPARRRRVAGQPARYRQLPLVNLKSTIAVASDKSCRSNGSTSSREG